jgi:N-methylhydantoinase A
VAVPSLDIHTIGAGGGSVARVDAGGALQVGPESAGADPGPACYGRGGTEATVTDANVVLGRLPAGVALGGSLDLDVDAAHAALARLGEAMGRDAEAAARGVLAVAAEHMAQALRMMSVERGEDPRDLALCCFGGAGGLHLCDVAALLGVDAAIVPAHGGVLSALGMLVARPERQLSRTLARPVADLDAATVDDAFAALEADAARDFSLSLTWDGDLDGLADRFHEAHEARYGHRLDAAVEVVTARLRASGPGAAPSLDDAPAGTGTPAGTVPVAGIDAAVPLWHRGELGAGQRVPGPAVIAEATATTWIAPGWTARAHGSGSLLLERDGDRGS